MRSLNTIAQYQKTEQKNLAEKKVEDFQLYWQIFYARALIANKTNCLNLYTINPEIC